MKDIKMNYCALDAKEHEFKYNNSNNEHIERDFNERRGYIWKIKLLFHTLLFWLNLQGR